MKKKSKSKAIAIFEGTQIRRHWDEEKELWYFSVIDVVRVLTGSSIPRRYWSDLKIKLKNEGSQLYEKIVQLKFMAQDGKYYVSDAADTEMMFRIIQSTPSPKAEPLKLWLAKVGTERIAEIQDPSQGIDRARALWKKYGRSGKWIQQRMMGQETRNKLTDYWKGHDVKEGDEYAVLTNIIHQEWADVSVQDHKNIKSLKKAHNLRDHMNEAELILAALAELSTRQIAESMDAKGFVQNKVPAKKGGRVAKIARKELESKTGKSVVTGENFLSSKEKPKNREVV